MHTGIFLGLATTDIIYYVSRHPHSNEKMRAERQLSFAGGPATNAAVAFAALGNAATLYMNMIALREDDRADLLTAALTVPAFWLMMSIAAAKGLYQLVRNPSYWEKTFHGLDKKTADAGDGVP